MNGVIVLVLAVVSVLSVWEPVWAESRQIATAQNATGVLVVVRADGVQERLQGRGSLPLYEGDILTTDTACRALIELNNGVKVALNEQTTFKLLVRWERYKPLTPIVRLTRGEIWGKALGGSVPLEIETPVANVSALESEFFLRVNDDGESALTVMQGVADFATPFDTCSVLAANVTSGVRGKICKKSAVTENPQTSEWTTPLLK